MIINNKTNIINNSKVLIHVNNNNIIKYIYKNKYHFLQKPKKR